MFWDPMIWLALTIKMAAAAALVVFATLAAERFGSLLGAMVAMPPISAGPALRRARLEASRVM